MISPIAPFIWMQQHPSHNKLLGDVLIFISSLVVVFLLMILILEIRRKK